MIGGILWLFLSVWGASLPHASTDGVKRYGIAAPSQAKATVVILSSPSCDHCKFYHDTVLPTLIQAFGAEQTPLTERLRIVFIPYFMDPFGWEVLKACSLKGEDHFLSLYHFFLTTQDQWMPQGDFEESETSWRSFVQGLGAVLEKKYASVSASQWSLRLQAVPDEPWLLHHQAVTNAFQPQALPWVVLMDRSETHILHTFSTPPRVKDIQRVLTSFS